MVSLESRQYTPSVPESPIAELDIPQWLLPRRDELRTVMGMATEIVDAYPQGPFAPYLIVTHHVPNPDNQDDSEYYYVGLEQMLPSEEMATFYNKAHTQAKLMAQTTPPFTNVYTKPIDIQFREAGVMFDPTGVEVHADQKALYDAPDEVFNDGITREVAALAFGNPTTFTKNQLPPKESVKWRDGVTAHIKAITRKNAVPTECVKDRQPPVAIDTGTRSGDSRLASAPLLNRPKTGGQRVDSISSQVGDPL